MGRYDGKLSVQGLLTVQALSLGLLQVQEYITTHELDVDHDNLSAPFTLVVPELDAVLGEHGDAPDQELIMLAVWSGVKRAQGKPSLSTEFLHTIGGEMVRGEE